jgi:DNA-binding NarL/FixJ family response regulator
MAGREEIRVGIIEDDDTLREGYAYLISSAAGLKVAGTYASFDLAEKTIRGDRPDVILLDLELPGTGGLDALPVLKKLLPRAQVIVLTVYENRDMVFKALANGAAGYLTKNASAAKITESIREVEEGGAPMTAQVARLVVGSFLKNQDSPLTKRETQVLALLSEGLSRSQIAVNLFIDPETVRSHVKNIYLKLGVNTRAEAIAVARAAKLI